jgi:hypothetical protein
VTNSLISLEFKMRSSIAILNSAKLSMADRPLRFCMVTTFYPPYHFGGDAILVHHLSNELARRGHSVDVIHCIDSYRAAAGREPPGTSSNHPNVTVHGLRSSFSSFGRFCRRSMM